MTIQAKMLEIYKRTGIEPKRWAESYYGLSGDIGDVTTEKDKSYCHGHGDYTKANIPYYSESQLWEMPKNFIEVDGKHYVKGAFNEMTVGYFRLDGNDDSDFMREDTFIEFHTDPDLHTALVDWVLWCALNGYIKGYTE